MPLPEPSPSSTVLRALAAILKKYKDAITVTLSIAAFVTSGLNYYVSHLWHAHDVRVAIKPSPIGSEAEEVQVLLVNAGKNTEVFVGAKFTHGTATPSPRISSAAYPFPVLVLPPGEVREISLKNDTAWFVGSLNQQLAIFNPLPENTLNAYLEFTYLDSRHTLAIARAKVGTIFVDKNQKRASYFTFTEPSGLVPIF